ncbi:MAG: hypothetical protein WCJ09_21210 [Planctomycetota bacterium]
MPTLRTAADIQRDMRQVRCDLNDEMDGLVDNAKQITEDFTDWRTYVKSNPLVFVGVAAVVGYWVMPTRVIVDRRVAQSLADLANAGTIKIERPAARSTFWNAAVEMGIGIVTSTAMQVGMTLLNRHVNQLIEPMNSTRRSPVPFPNADERVSKAGHDGH